MPNRPTSRTTALTETTPLLMDGIEREDGERFPPGTIQLERRKSINLISDRLDTDRQPVLDQTHCDIILQPKPTSDPNDPLNWSKAWKLLNFGLVCFYTLIVFVNLDIMTVICSFHPVWYRIGPTIY